MDKLIFIVDDEQAISKQSNRINVKSFEYCGGIAGKEENIVLKEFLRGVDVLIVCSTVEKYIVDRLKPKKPYFVFQGKYDKDDFKILRELFQ